MQLIRTRTSLRPNKGWLRRNYTQHHSNMTEVFPTAGKSKGLQAWRVENLRLVANEEALKGNFYEGDSYVVLNTKIVDSKWDIHYWLGDESTQDEIGGAAVLSVQLNTELGGSAIIYRQTQQYEGTEFSALFRSGVKYMKGGFESAFHKTQTNVSDAIRLLHVKGRRVVRANEVALSWRSFNHGDCFILDYKNTVIQWNGKECNAFERVKANKLAQDIINYEKGGKGKLSIHEDGDDIPPTMMKVLEGSPSDILPSIPDDEVVKEMKKVPAILYHVCADTGTLVITKVSEAPFDQTKLDSGDAYILDDGAHGKIFVWKGKGASHEERIGALKNASKFIEEKGYSPNTGVEVMAQEAESILFKQYFKNWKNKYDSVGFGKQYTNNRIAKVEQIKFDMKTLGSSKLAAKHRMWDDGSGKLQIWKVEDGLKPVEGKMHGIFYSGECYIMLYTYVGGPEIIYFWIGQQATLKQITRTTFMAVRLSHKRDGRNVQVRVVQGKEPSHLISCFKGRPMIIISGKPDDAPSEKSLLQVFFTGIGGRAIQVDTTAKSLNSNDAFLMQSKSKTFIWVGIGASEDEIEGAKFVAGKLDASVSTVIKEGSESSEFWSLLGGKQKYADHPRLQESLDDYPPRLFGISDASGRLVVEEVPGEFTQADLCQDDVMVLDVWDQIFVWIGKGATKQERESGPKLAQEYLDCDPRSRDKEISIVTISQGHEPLTFTGFLPTWNKDFNYNIIS